MGVLMKRTSLLVGMAVVLASFSSPALAFNNRVSAPPVVLSPDLVEPWTNQLQPGYKMRNKKARRSARHSRRARRTRARARNTTLQRATGSHRRPAATTQAAPQRQIAPQFLPTVVDYNGPHRAGTIIVDTNARYLYLVEGDGRARRYGVGVGKAGFTWSGTERITRKAEWPDWRPPASMIARERAKGRHLPAFMAGGPNNPLGARALYLGSSLYRIHGSNQPWTIGHAVSSGCIRMRNQDVTDLYTRVGVGTKVVVL